MITIEPIKTNDAKNYSFIEELLITAFPDEERRDLSLQRHFTDKNPLFFNNIIKSDGHPVGLITYWDFDEFYYVEHFAISPDTRNGGYGKKVMTLLDEIASKPVVLEVERPEDEMSERRIGFYSRLGYVLWEKDYKQPPYKKEHSYLPMYIMVKGNMDCEKDYEKIKTLLYKNVYLVEE